MDAKVHIGWSGGAELMEDRFTHHGDGPIGRAEHGAGDIIFVGGALAAATLVPFLQAMSTHLGERAATAIAGVWSRVVNMRSDSTAAPGEGLSAETPPYEMLLEGPNGARVFLNADLPAEAVRQLVEMGAEGLGSLGSDPSLRWHGQVWRANTREGSVVVGEMYWHPVAKTWGHRPPQVEQSSG